MDSYRRVYESILSGDQEAAETAFSGHMQWAIEIMKGYMPRVVES